MKYYFIFNKPYRVLCQFSPVEGKLTLSDFLSLPKDVYPVGRLDYDSEGLIILTNDGLLHHKLIDPRFSHSRTYWVQVEGIPDSDAIDKLSEGVVIENKKTRKANVRILTEEPRLWERNPPIRFRKSIPTSWLEIELFEGRNRQIRKMTAAVGYPTLRLVRIKIEFLEIFDLKPGEFRELKEEEIKELKRICGLR
ncbi:MAG: pseudouridine synthase [Ignavibacteria bacterium]|jgi:23S rRNA pseudouridine2457 synthase|nr:pseudouridine synthase [Ignavibacteria bacterium]MDH7526727.1 pseudouridine synthase [Ignavibacteria bacterium]